MYIVMKVKTPRKMKIFIPAIDLKKKKTTIANFISNVIYS